MDLNNHTTEMPIDSRPNANSSFTNLILNNPYWPWIYFSFGTCLIIHHLLSPYFCGKYNRVYPNLPWRKRMEWDSRVVSSIHAVAVTSLCIYTLLNDKQMWIDPLGYESKSGQIAVSLSMGYFLCDLLSMPIYWRGTDLFIFVLHHSAAIILIGVMLFYRGCSIFGVYRLVTEASTPFTNQRWFFLTSGVKASRRRVAISSLIFAILFIITRNGLIVPFWMISYSVYSSKQHVEFKTAFPYVDIIWFFIPATLDVLNIYWSFAVYRIGWKAIKILYIADWKTDILKAKERLKKLRSRRWAARRNSCDSLNTFCVGDIQKKRNYSGTNMIAMGANMPLDNEQVSFEDMIGQMELEEYLNDHNGNHHVKIKDD